MTTPNASAGPAQPVLAEQRDAQPGAEPEVRVEQRLVGDRDRRGAQQQRDEVEHRQHRAVALPAGEERAEQDAQRGLDRPRQRPSPGTSPTSACSSPGSVEHRTPAGRARRVDRADAVPRREAQREHADQRDDGEARRRTPAPAAPATAGRCRGRAAPGAADDAARRYRLTGGCAAALTVPMTAFMLSANCCGEIDSWNSLAMLSSSVSAAVGLSAWSQDWREGLGLGGRCRRRT